MKKWFGLLGVCAALSIGVAQADVVTLEEHQSGDEPTFNLSSIINEWGTPADSNGTSDTEFIVLGTGTNDLAGLNIINNLGFTITSLQVYAYGTIEGGSFDYNCGVNNYFTGCTPGSGVNLPSGSVISQNDPVEWDYSGTGGGENGIANGQEFRLTDSVDGLSNTDTALFYEIEIDGTPFTAATPEPATVIPVGAGLLAMGPLAARRRKACTQ